MKYEEVVVRETIEYKKVLLKKIKKELFEYIEYNIPLNDFFEKNIVLGRDRIIDNITREYFQNEDLYNTYIDTKVEEFIEEWGSEDCDEDCISDFFNKKYPEEQFIKKNFNKQIIFNEMLKEININIYDLFNSFRRKKMGNDLNFYIIYIFYIIVKKDIYIEFMIQIIKDYLEFKKEIINDIEELINIIFIEETLETSSIYNFIKKYDKDFNYKKGLMKELYHLTDNEKKYIFEKKETKKNAKALIWTEGKTDWKHLKKALLRFQDKGEYLDLNIEFKEFNNISTSDTELANYAESLAKQVNVQKTICIFDRDLPDRLKDYGQNEFTHVANKQLINTIKDKCKNEYGERSKKYLDIEKKLEVSKYKKIDKEIKSILTGKEYKEWKIILKNNVYAFCIPEIRIHFRKLRKINFLNTRIKLTLRDFQHHYKEFGKNSIDKLNEVCIEFYYKEKDLKKEDSHGKRLFTADEFEFNKKTNDCNQFISKCRKFKTDTQSGNNKKTKHITLQYPNKNDRGYVYRNDDEECNKSTNMNLTKNEFAENIYNEVEGFNDFDIENFRLIFDVIEKILND